MTTGTLLSQIKQHYLAIHSEAVRSEDGESAQRHLAEFWQRIQPILEKIATTESCWRSPEEWEKLEAHLENQRKRIVYLEGATNHAGGTPLSLAKLKIETLEQQLAALQKQHADTLAGYVIIEKGLEAERNRLRDTKWEGIAKLEQQLAEARRLVERRGNVIEYVVEYGKQVGLSRVRQVCAMELDGKDVTDIFRDSSTKGTISSPSLEVDVQRGNITQEYAEELEAARKDSERLEWIMARVNNKGTDGLLLFPWTLIEENGDDVKVAFDRACIDAAKGGE